MQGGATLQQRIKAWNEAQTNDRLRFDLHIGIDSGEVLVLPNGDVRGNAANRAARVCAQCPGGEVYFTEKVTVELHAREVQIAKVGAFPLKGMEEQVTIYRLLRWLGTSDGVLNPFVWRAGITKAEDFFDREHEQRTLRAYLRGRQNCQIASPRRIGKTSLLRQIERAASGWDSTVVVAYLDLHDPRCYDLSGWLTRVSRQFSWARPPADLAAFAECIEETIAAGQRPVLCLDEFEELTVRRTEFTRDFFLTLRACGQQGMSIVTASRKRLSDLTELSDPTSPFYNTFPLLRLGPFADKDAQDFVAYRHPGVAPFTAEEQETILAFAKGHPLALQVACAYVLEARENGQSLVATLRQAEDDMRAHLPTGW